jgi:hypothetical protein
MRRCHQHRNQWVVQFKLVGVALTSFVGLNILLRNRFTSRFAFLLWLPPFTFGVSPVFTGRPFFPSLFPPRIMSRLLAVIGFFQMR